MEAQVVRHDLASLHRFHVKFVGARLFFASSRKSATVAPFLLSPATIRIGRQYPSI
jgi:hypothetical protein